MNRKEEILEDLDKLKQETQLDAVFLSIVDILEESNVTFVVSETEEEVIK